MVAVFVEFGADEQLVHIMIARVLGGGDHVTVITDDWGGFVNFDAEQAPTVHRVHPADLERFKEAMIPQSSKMIVCRTSDGQLLGRFADETETITIH